MKKKINSSVVEEKRKSGKRDSPNLPELKSKVQIVSKIKKPSSI
jgi:hypothetical protein